MITGLLFAVVAAVLNTVAGMLESDATRTAAPGRPLIARPRYVVGLVVDGLGWLSTVAALRTLPVFLVQAVLASTIVLTAVGARIVYRTPIRRGARYAMGACVAGLVLVALSAGPQRPAAASEWTVAALVAAVGLLVVGVAAGWQGGRAWPLSVVAGLGFGFTSLAVRAAHLGGQTGWSLLAEPAVYLVVAFWLVGMAAYTRALALTSVARLTPVMVVSETVIPGLAGIVLLGDTVRPGWWWPMLAGLALAVGGVAVLAASPTPGSPTASRVPGHRTRR